MENMSVMNAIIELVKQAPKNRCTMGFLQYSASRLLHPVTGECLNLNRQQMYDCVDAMVGLKVIHRRATHSRKGLTYVYEV